MKYVTSIKSNFELIQNRIYLSIHYYKNSFIVFWNDMEWQTNKTKILTDF